VAEIQSINYPLHPSRLAQWPPTFHSGLDRRQFLARRTILSPDVLRDGRSMVSILPQTQGSSTTANSLDYRPLR